LALLEAEDRALLVVDVMQFLVLFPEVEDLSDHLGDVAVLFDLLGSCLDGDRLSDDGVLETVGSCMG
jgi:hypothetical protein